MGINLETYQGPSGVGNVYVIKCTRHEDDWYFSSIDDQYSKVVWVAEIENSQLFTSRSTAAKIKAIFLSERECSILPIE